MEDMQYTVICAYQVPDRAIDTLRGDCGLCKYAQNHLSWMAGQYLRSTSERELPAKKVTTVAVTERPSCYLRLHTHVVALEKHSLPSLHWSRTKSLMNRTVAAPTMKLTSSSATKNSTLTDARTSSTNDESKKMPNTQLYEIPSAMLFDGDRVDRRAQAARKSAAANVSTRKRATTIEETALEIELFE